MEPEYWNAKCRACGWRGSSKDTNGGMAIADTGDFSDLRCPHCNSTLIDETDEGPHTRPAGWYFVRFENWDGGHDDWCPAWWDGMYWGSYRYSGIHDSGAIVGDKIVMPNV